MNLLEEPQGPMVQHFTTLVKRHAETGLLFRMLQFTPGSRAFVGFCLKRLLEGEDALALFQPSEFVRDWPLIARALQGVEGGVVTLENHVKRLVSDTTLVGFLSGYAFDPESAGLYRRILTHVGSGRPDFMQWFVNGLNALDASQWLTELSRGGELLLAALEAHAAGGKIMLGDSYLTALLEHAARLRRGEQPAPLLTNANNPADLLDQRLKGDLRDSLYNQAAQSKGSAEAPFFELYGPELLSAPALFAGAQVVEDLFRPIIEKRNVAGLNWMGNFFEGTTVLSSQTGRPDVLREIRGLLDEAKLLPNDEATPHLHFVLKRILQLIEQSSGTGP